MIQLYVRTDELIPHEGMTTKEREELVPDIKENGFIYSIKVNPNGEISFGNTRYWAARLLDIKYIPIDINWFTGYSFIPSPTENIVALKKEFLIGLLQQTELQSKYQKVTYQPKNIDPALDTFMLKEGEQDKGYNVLGTYEFAIFRQQRELNIDIKHSSKGKNF